ncbi:hypothetical protein A7A76_13535 [Lysobacter enzymogenes]|uniref:SDR family NAD(P)-dependent oxidoreductase n=1 Tax=Lysobacter enzymogenes TaxID=69 RepID=UPI0019D11C61|nr:SDR family NAD(P)-dependent oxidoreductase [Lysobacter enzymogenes]MBN7135745.1 hypothetical protein [Lysobacter enzymogenes]
MKINREDVAVIGLSGRFPGAADTAEFWDGLCAGRDAIRALDDQALRAAGVAEAELSDPDYVKAGAPLDGVELFDAGLFKVSPLEAELMDPQIRLLLQCAWETLEDAGYGGREPRRIGVFAGAGGVGTSYFSHYVNRLGRFEKITASPTHLGNDKDFLATYLSYKLNLTGPSMTVQTACSTSLVALHQARLSLMAGECDMALAGGVSVRVPNGHGYRYKDGYIFSRSGRVRSFDAGADGVVFGSGMGLVLIKRLSDALRDGDPVRAVIKGSAIGNDGKGKMSYAASSARGQIACIRAALADAGVDAASIGLVEAHGTGTAMGDPEEVKALSAAFREDTDAKGYCALGAVKANIGHLEAAAGIVGFIKAALAVERGVIPPLLHFQQANPRIKFDATPFFVNTQAQPWLQKGPRRAAVNSLGVGGTNAFVVLEQAPARKPAAKRRAAAAPALVPISACSDDSLREYAARLARFIARAQADKTPLDLSELACTLQVGRETLAQRAAFAVSSLAQLRERLDAFAAGGEGDAAADLPALAAQWLADGNADWDSLYPGGRPRRIGLPTYVFARERHWIDEAPAAPARAMLHPLLHANTSDLAEVRYSSLFHGDEFFLRDHRVRGGEEQSSPVLPGVAYLEMARAALAQAGVGGQAWELRDVVWLQSATISGERRLDLALIAHAEARVDFEAYGEPDTIHCQGRALACEEAAPPRLDLDAARSTSAQQRWDHDAVYAAFAEMGLDYGPAHRPIVELQRGGGEALARLRLPAAQEADAGQFGLHPSLLDGALQAATWLLIDPDDAPERPLVPFALASLRQYSALPSELHVVARRAPGEGGALDLDLCDSDGAVCASLRGFLARPFGKSAHSSLRATRVWQEAAAQPAPAREALRTVICGLPQIDPAAIDPRAQAVALDPQADQAQRYTALAQHCLGELKAVLSARPRGEAAFQVVVPDRGEDALLLGLSGMLLSAGAENPRLRAQLIAVDPAIDAPALAALLRRERESAHEPLLRLRAGRREAARWQLLPEPADAGADTALALKHGGTYLITGGLGGLGLVFARDLLRRCPGVRVLLGGRASAEAVRESPRQAALDALRGEGLQVEYVQLDLDDAAALRERLHALAARYGRIDGIVHSAGAIADGLIATQPLDALDAVLAPKVRGTFNLDAASAELDLDFIALFSSLSAALGNAGQAGYAAANGFLDEFAGQRNRLAAAGARRGHTLAIAWPYWREGGMRLDADGEAALSASTGVRPLRSATGLRLFHRSLAEGRERVLVMDGDSARMRAALGLDAAPARRAATVDASAIVATAPAGDLHALAQRLLCERMADLLKLPAQRLDPAAPLEDYGIDSILALDLTRLLEASFGALPRTLFFEYLSIAELAGYFAREHADTLRRLDAGDAAQAPATTQPAPSESTPRAGAASLRRPALRAAADSAGANRYADEPIAIVGLSGRYPQARDLDAFWRNLRDGRDCIEEIPASRWNWRDYYSEDRSVPGRHYSKWGGFIEGVDEFDARFFNIAPIEAELLDPQERLFLEHAWMAIEDAGLTRAALQIPAGDARAAQELAGQVGVYAGVMYGEYQLIGAENSLRGKRMGFASNPASVANRVSYALNLHGPSMTVDTMCSSSLSAIHLACQDLKLGRTDAAIAGGVNVTVHPNKYLMLSAGQFISGDGHCQSFGEGGDGYIPGEGVGAVVLKRLSDAQRDGNRVYGLIRGSALSHGGKTNGYTVPNPQAQASAIRQALRESGLPARRIGYVEAHGTGTRLGDPIEIAALTKVFRESSGDSGFCLIGSAKSNIGHCEAAAGIAGLTKVLLQLQHGQIVPSLHSARLNPHIDFAATPFVVNQGLRDWPAPLHEGRALPRVAGISSFGAGGSNAHLIVEEYLAPVSATVSAPAADAAQMLPLSARTAEQLRRKAADLLAWLEQPGREVVLADLAYTLQSGREAMDERMAVIADSPAQLRERLRAWLDGDEREVHRGQAKASRERLADAVQGLDLAVALAQWRERGEHAAPLRLWALGLELDWAALRPLGAATRRMLALPAYPFARQRHWIEPVAADKAAARIDALHPLLHSNESGIDRCAYSARFDGDEFFLAAGALSEAACLEMARAAVAHALAPSRPGLQLQLRELAWAQPRRAPVDGSYRISLFEPRGERVRFEIHSGDGADEVVHCQGVAVYVEPINADAIAAGATELALPAALAGGLGDYALHPALLQAAFAAASAQAPLGLDSLSVLGAAAAPSRLALRPASGAAQAFDLDLCAADGRVWAQLRGLRFAAATARAGSDATATLQTTVAATPSAAVVAPANIAPRRITFAAPAPAVLAAEVVDAAPASLDKPRAIALAPAAAAAGWPASATAKPRVSLSAAGAAIASAPQSPLRGDIALFDEGQGVFALHLHGGRGFDAEAAATLAQALRAAAAEPSLKALLVLAAPGALAGGDAAVHAAALDAGLYRAAAEFPYPLIAALRGDADGPGLLFAALADALVCAEQGRYALASNERGLPPRFARELARLRFGRALADDLLLRPRGALGRELAQAGWTCSVLAADAVEAHGRAFAADLAAKSASALGLLKQELAAPLLEAACALAPIDAASAGSEPELADAAAPELPAAAQGIRAYPLDAGVMALEVRAQAGAAWTDEVRRLLAALAADVACRGVVLACVDALPAPSAEQDAFASLQALAEAVAALDRPVIAALPAGADGAAWLAALLCDGVVYAQDAGYDAHGLFDDAALAAPALSVFAARLGEAPARRLLLGGLRLDGAALAREAQAVRAAPASEAIADAGRLAAELAQWPRAELALWKRAETALFAQATTQATAEQSAQDEGEPAAGAIDLDSQAISARWHPGGVLEIGMHDRSSRNMFSPEFSRGLRAAFAHAESPACRAVVLSGFERYFAAGGTRDTLLAIHQGRARFTDDKVFELPLRCPVPVVAAMQGHAVGAGWALGMYADVALFSSESRYFSPYMGYGFTPGAGSTLLFAQRIGRDLARESLLSAREYAGDELVARGLRQPLSARAQTVAEALALAARIARLPRARLLALKREWNRALEAGLEQTYAHELAMHERTFVGQAETLALIERSFAAPGEAAAVPLAAASAAAAAAPLALADIVAELRRSLAHELRLPEEEIGADEEFVVLGLDSITGVTWIRRVNERYGTAIEAIQVYSHPTLQRLAQHVRSLAVAAPALAPAPAAAVASERDAGADVAATLRRLLAEELRLSEQDIGADEPFVDLGLDSITGVTWVRRINERYGTAIEAVQVYSHPTLARLSAFVADKAGALAAPADCAPAPISANAGTAPDAQPDAEPARVVLAAQRHNARRSSAASADAIAVIGMSGQFAQARDLEQFWDNLANARDCIAEVPAQRWDLARYYQPGDAVPGKTNSRWLGALEDYDRFDPAFFNISPREARSMDPQQRLFLQACWHGIEHAGYNPKALAGSNCGVFVGCAAGDYHQLSRRERLSGQGFTGAAPSILAARISYFLDLHGPSLAVDTACSSSLVALANACDSLASGATDLALAGGVNVMAGPAMHIMTAQVGMLGAGGRCRTFDAAADGIALGEGVGVVVLKRLADAERDGDCIHGVIEAWGVNQDGRSNGITAPNADAQARLQGEVYRRFGVDPAGIQLIEAHGTGTALGDPIEVAALKTSFAAHTARSGYCALGSVKSNIGHCLSAAGVSGVLKLLLALRHRQLPPTLHFSTLNPHIALDGSPFYVNDRLREWNVEAGARRRAAINAFGFSGTNAHAVIAEYRPRPAAASARGAVLAPLSAATPEQLRHKARELLVRVEAGVEDLASLAYTLQVGREAMGERAAVVASDAAGLARGLRVLAESDDAAALRAAGVLRGRAGTDKDTLAAFAAEPDFQRMLERWIDGGELARLGELWVKGLALDWRRFHAAGAPRRMALPLHPFARERYWIEAEDEAAAPMPPVAPAAPLAEPAAVQTTHAAAATFVAEAADPARNDAAALERLQAQLRESLAEALFMRAAEIGLDKPFNELGLDSIVGVEWVNALNRQLGCELSATRIYDYPSVRALATYLLAAAPSAKTAAVAAATAMAPVAATLRAAPAALREELRESLAEALFMRPADIGWSKSFAELGLDSIVGVEWIKNINRRYGTALSATRVYDYPSIDLLAAFLAEQTGAVGAAAVVEAPAPAAAPQAPARATDELQRELRDSLAEALYMRPGDIGLDKSFTELGLDSIVGVEWMKQVNQRYGTQIAALRVYDYPSVRSLAAHLLEHLPAAPAAALRAHAPARSAEAAAGVFAPLATPAAPRSDYFGAGERSGDFAADGELSLLYRIAPERNVGLREHVVFGRHLLPTDAYVELLLAAFAEHFGDTAVALRDLALANPLLGEPGSERRLRLTLRRHAEGLQCFVRSSAAADGGDETLHLSGLLVPADATAPVALRREFAVERRLARSEIATNAGDCYAPLHELAFGADAASGRIRSAAGARFHADPFALYGALCTAINAAGHIAAQRYGAHDDQFLPHRLGRVVVAAGAAEASDLHSHAELRRAEADALEFDVELSDAAGRVRARLDGLVLRRVGRAALQRRDIVRRESTNALPAPRAVAAASEARNADKIAIVGMSCRFPKSEDLDAFWDNLAQGRDCIGEIPPQRWAGQGDWFHPDPRHPRTSYSKWAGLLDDIAAFDPLFFGISPAEAELIDPQQRIFLEQCWKAIEHAGYAPGALSGQACGVYVGCAAGDYARVLGAAGQDGAGAAFMGTSSAILAARIAYFLNLKGAALAVDTACSSSLVALHLACESIRSGENAWALCGGINLLTTPIGHVLTSQVGMPSRDGRCAAFDASAGGIVFSEGCGVVLLKSLAQAQADNDRILGVIEGSGINQDGKTNGITAPSAQAQERLLSQVYARHGIDPARIGYVEAHGTATALGDPIEVDALRTVFDRAGAAAGGCALGSVKSNIGHTGFAAGVAGVIKVLLCLQQRELVPTVHYTKANPHIRFEDSPFYVNTERRDWRSDSRRLATVSSFGFSGTNAHVVIGEHVAAEEAAPAAGPALLPLSARSAAQLRAKAADLLAWLQREPAPDLQRLAYTLQVGRDAMEHRLGCIAADAEQLRAQLQGWLDGRPRVPGLEHGRADGEDRTLAVFAADEDMRAVFEQWIERGQLPKLLELWVRGLDIDWRRLHRGRAPRRLSLPDYPFARDRCWVQPVASAAAAATQARLHPLLHRNTSDLSLQSYRSGFDGSEFFLADHRVRGRRVLPAVAQLEMARAAFADALPLSQDGALLELRHVAWAQPLSVDGPCEVGIAVYAEDDGALGFEIYSHDADADDEILHCQGRGAAIAAPAPAPLDLVALRQRMRAGRNEAAALYPHLAGKGLEYGPAFQGVVAIERGAGETLAELRLPGAAAGEGYVLHPSLLDSALQASIPLIEAASAGAVALPFALESLRAFSPCAPRMHAWVRYAADGAAEPGSGRVIKVDIDLCDDEGAVCVQMRGFASRPLPPDAPCADEFNAAQAVELG